MKERRLKQFSLCTMLCGLSGLITSLNNIFALGIPLWALCLLTIPAVFAIGWLAVLGIRHLMGRA